ncbi:MAG TPA: hypothetical protein PLP14_11170, partial [Chitinophagaceae bacterium]|nr:hypothetical protein [Chitinophagaceae bacterium]
DFPWRYTPAKANGNRLRPWITLVVLSEDEFEEGKNMNHKPLPYFRIRDGKKTADLFPLPGELWAWAHVHVNEDLSEGAAANTIADPIIQDAMNDVLKNDPDKAYSRILCPRKLQPNKGYHAFLIPSFETGRLAGLGYDIPANTAATASAWDTEAQIEFPYYHRWYFRTGNTGDFEFLVNLLKPQPADKRVGVRDIDVVHPGSNLPPITNPDLLGVLKLGGALRVPYDTMKTIDKQEVDRYDQWDEHPYPHEFSTAMARRINLADDYSQAFKDIQTANQEAGILVDMENTGDPDPVITSPLYGQWHALQERLLIKRDETPMSHPRNWIHELNLDPRFRVAAGLGTKVVQQEQEKFMQSAWEQVGDILQANNKIRWAQLAKEVSIQWYSKHLLALQPVSLFTFTAPVSKRMTWNNFTLFHQWTESPVPPAIHSGS